MADAPSPTATTTPAPTEIAVSDVAAHFAAVVASAQAHVALIQSRPALYPGGLPAALDAMVRQLGFLTTAVQKAAPAAPAAN